MHGGVNQRLLVPELYDVIVPARCRCRVKKNKVVLLLKTGPPVVPFSAWQNLSSGAADPVDTYARSRKPPLRSDGPLDESESRRVVRQTPPGVGPGLEPQ